VGAAGADAVMAARRDGVDAAAGQSEAKLISGIDNHSQYAVIGIVVAPRDWRCARRWWLGEHANGLRAR
jgi:hypothetical protein